MANIKTHKKLRARRWWLAAIAVVLLLVLVRALMPHWVLNELNRRLAVMGEYHGEASAVDLALYRGAYVIHGLRIDKRGGDPGIPLLDAPRIALSLSWRALFRGALVGEVDFYRPQLNFVDGRKPEENVTGAGQDWRARLEMLFPVRIDAIRVHDGVMAFRNPWSRPAVDLRATQVEGSIVNLTNVRDAAGRRDASFDLHALVLGQARAEVAARFDPWGAFEDFSLDLRIAQIDLTRLNDFARAYAALDFASGQGQFVMELDAVDGRLRGYAKPLLEHLDILDWEQDVKRDGDHPLRLLWEGLSGAVAGLFRNQAKDRFATRIEIDGRVDDPHVKTLGAILGVLRNAFVEAYEAQFENLLPRSRQD